MTKAFPHCDSRILHSPNRCIHCDMYPEWQELRRAWGIDFTDGSDPDKLPCPAVAKRGVASLQKWYGNVPVEDKLEPESVVQTEET